MNFDGSAMTYCVSVLEPGAVLPKCAAARTASAAIWSMDGMFRTPAVNGTAGDALSNHTPLSREPLGTPTCDAPVGQVTVPEGTPWQYCWLTFVQSSPLP